MSNSKKCPLCGGYKTVGETTFSVDLDKTLVVTRNVPASICGNCGNEWLSDRIAESIEQIVNNARKEQREFEVIQFKKVA